MTIKDKKALDRQRSQLLRRAEAIQRHLDEVTRAAREELVSIRDQIHDLDAIRETPEDDGERQAKILDRKSITVQKKVQTVLLLKSRLTTLNP